MRPDSEPSADPIGEGISGDVADRIRLVVLDVDGVLTDAGVYIGVDPRGEPFELKRFDIVDGLGINLLRSAGIEVAIVSGRESEATAARARELGIEECHQDPGAAKLPIVRRLAIARGLEWESVAMLGDDLPDIPVLRAVGLPAAVANAQPEVKREATWVSTRRGGDGAVREFARALLLARGSWATEVDEYLRVRSDG